MNTTRKSSTGTNEQEIIQNIVWAELKGHSAWPAQICLSPEHLKKPKNAQK